MNFRIFIFKLFSIMVLGSFEASLVAAWDPTEFTSKYQIKDTLREESFLKLKKRIIDQSIKGWCSEAEANLIIDLVFLTKPTTCVEVGTFNGSFFLPMAATLGYLKQGQAYAINSWSNELAVKHINTKDENYHWWSTVDMQSAKNEVTSMISQWSLNSFCKVLHATPEKGLEQIQSIDFLHLLGGLSEQESLRNVQLYLPKVKSNGYVLLSNVFLYIDGKHPKMKALWMLLDECEIVCEIDSSNAILFRKN